MNRIFFLALALSGCDYESLNYVSQPVSDKVVLRELEAEQQQDKLFVQRFGSKQIKPAPRL